jgi:hypothetical protein
MPDRRPTTWPDVGILVVLALFLLALAWIIFR